MDEPVCGYTGSKCDNTPYIYGSAALFVVIVAAVAFGVYKRYE